MKGSVSDYCKASTRMHGEGCLSGLKRGCVLQVLAGIYLGFCLVAGFQAV